jgi:hypothetical protein
MDMELILLQLVSLLGSIANGFLNTTANSLDVVGHTPSSSEIIMANSSGLKMQLSVDFAWLDSGSHPGDRDADG